MNYIYDILANFNEEYYEFYDWNEEDSITHIKKTPIIKTNSEFLHNIKYNEIIVEKHLLEKIYKKTEYYNTKSNKLNYVCIITDGKTSIISKFNENGKILERSSLIIEEENEIIDLVENIEQQNFSYNVNKKNKYELFKTRKEKEISKYILTQLENINEDKLRYIYFDCFNKEEQDTKKIKTKLKTEIKNNFNEKCNKLYNLLKMTS